MRKTFSAALFALALPFAAVAADFDIDPAHSSVTFKIRHLVSKTAGHFEKFTGTLSYEPGKPETWQANAVIDTASINTNNKKRDDHLKGPDFFDVKKFPKMTFKSTKVSDVDDNEAKLHGDLTLHGVTKPVVLDIEFTGAGTDPWGTQKIGFTGKTKVNRKDFGIEWNKTLDAGGLMLGEEVEIVLEIEADQKKDATAKKAKK